MKNIFIVITFIIFTFLYSEYYIDTNFNYIKSSHDITGIAYDSTNKKLIVLIDDADFEFLNPEKEPIPSFDFCTLEIVNPESGETITTKNIATGPNSSNTEIGYLGGYDCDVDEKGNIYINSYYGFGVEKLLYPLYNPQYATTGGNDWFHNSAENNTIGISVIKEDTFFLMLNNVKEENSNSSPEGIQGWQNATTSTGKQSFLSLPNFENGLGLANDKNYLYVGNNFNNNPKILVIDINAYTLTNLYLELGTDFGIIADIECDREGYVWVLSRNGILRKYKSYLQDEEKRLWKETHSFSPLISITLPQHKYYYSLALSENAVFVAWSNGHDALSGIIKYIQEPQTFSNNYSHFK